MTLFVLRLRNGNCVVVAAGDDAAARQRANLRADVEIATVRELESFAAQFLLTDNGELKTILLDEQTLADLRAHEYPILNSARTQSHADFNSSETDSKADLGAGGRPELSRDGERHANECGYHRTLEKALRAGSVSRPGRPTSGQQTSHRHACGAGARGAARATAAERWKHALVVP